MRQDMLLFVDEDFMDYRIKMTEIAHEVFRIKG